MTKLFGTDGVRGKANQFPITAAVALQLGKAIAVAFRSSGHGGKRAIIGKDTRLSGYMIESAMTAGMVSMGMDVYLVGPMPTPALAHLTKSMGAAAGVMITASHNPSEDNGIKLFNHDGFKLSDALENEIEALVLGDEIASHHIANDQMGKAYRIEDARGRYIEFAKNTIRNRSLAGLKIVVDCGNGAAYFLGPLIFKELGAEVVKLGVEPDGYNINHNCGALAVDACCQRVVDENADLGIALDGDADRVVFVDRRGDVVHGDRILGLLATEFNARGALPNHTLVATVMSNWGLRHAMNAVGITVEEAAVGDRYVIEAMRNGNHGLGGEASGHIVVMEHGTTGDGIISALQVLKIMIEKECRDLSELTRFIEIFPHRLVNVPVTEKVDFMACPPIADVLRECTDALGECGRHLIRYSGTENLMRILVEAKTRDDVECWIERIETVVRRELGVG